MPSYEACINVNEDSRKNFCGTLENCEKCESLAQQIFPRLRYVSIHFMAPKWLLDTVLSLLIDDDQKLLTLVN